MQQKRSFTEIYGLAKTEAVHRFKGLLSAGRMVPFPDLDDPLRDPWLDWKLEHRPDKIPDEVLVLQDWGEERDATDAKADVAWLDRCLKRRCKCLDPTIRNLIETRGPEIIDGRFMVMNAVWALRPTGDRRCRCGYLGDQVHKAAFPVWSIVLEWLWESRPDFKLLMGGDWAKWSDQRFGRNTKLKYHFDRWSNWAVGKRFRLNLSGNVDLVPHPAVWGFSLIGRRT